MSQTSLASLDVRMTRGLFAVTTTDDNRYIIETFAHPDGQACLGINGGALESVIIGASYLDLARSRPSISCGHALVASRHGREPLETAPVVSIVPFGAGQVCWADSEPDTRAEINHADHFI